MLPRGNPEGEVVLRSLGRALVLVALVISGCGNDTIQLASNADAGAPDAGRGRVDAGRVPVCQSNADCKSGPAVCDVELGRCVECMSDTDCLGFLAPRCETASHACVQCLTTNDCPAATVCDQTSNQCGVHCGGETGCFPPFSICDAASGVCVECETDADCANQRLVSAEARLCVLGSCLECVKDSDCGAAKPYCASFGGCVECLQSTECEGGTCDPFEHECRAG